ncbi:histone-lysine N-methyltransferase ASHR2 [Iris pallida]|uniref:Histone-lysine N-methyltransferase ASHR2 n=1 Tax=Iris pallida TaxID=29817 RepID=A0AAX6HX97_IRIPA|nr:histone-lysine N-methyltransferase ASHR2 [Iris pallida]
MLVLPPVSTPMAAASSPPPLVQVADLAGRGRSLIATRHIKPGEILLSDSPLLLYPSSPPPPTPTTTPRSSAPPTPSPSPPPPPSTSSLPPRGPHPSRLLLLLLPLPPFPHRHPPRRRPLQRLRPRRRPPPRERLRDLPPRLLLQPRLPPQRLPLRLPRPRQRGPHRQLEGRRGEHGGRWRRRRDGGGGGGGGGGWGFPHAYFFVKFVCDVENCGGTLAPLPPSDDGTVSDVLECNVCGKLRKEGDEDGDGEMDDD